MLAAAAAGNIKWFSSTLKYVQNINFEGDLKETALHKAAGGGCINIVHLLLEKGGSIDAINKNDCTPLHLAVREGHTSIAKLLLKKGAPTEALNKDNYTPLHLAASIGHTGMV